MWVPRPQGGEFIIRVEEGPAPVNGPAGRTVLDRVRVEVGYAHHHVGELTDQIQPLLHGTAVGGIPTSLKQFFNLDLRKIPNNPLTHNVHKTWTLWHILS